MIEKKPATISRSGLYCAHLPGFARSRQALDIQLMTLGEYPMAYYSLSVVSPAEKSLSPAWLEAHRLSRLIPNHPPQELKKISQMDNWMLIAGNPHPKDYQVFRGKLSKAIFGVLCLPTEYKLGRVLAVTDSSKTEDSVLEALASARAARFEHGEQP